MSRRRTRGMQPAGRPARLSVPDRDAVADAVAGYRCRLSPVSLAEAIDRLDRGWLSSEEIARRLGCTSRTVQRHRARRRAEARS
jgi:FixJ family two-component response regulator